MLFRKMLRDMKANRTQFISIFLLAFLGVFIYAGVSSEYHGLNAISEEFYQETNMADAWIYSKGFSEEAQKAVEEVSGVVTTERRLTLNSTADFDNNPTVTLHFVEEYQISMFHLIKGEEFSITSKDGIWLDNRFAEARKLDIGDKITLNINGLPMEKVVKGLIMSPEYVYYSGEGDVIPDHATYGYGFLSDQAFPKEIPMIYTDLLLRCEGNPDDALESRVDQVLSGEYSAFVKRDSFRSYMQFHEEMKEHKAMGSIFPVMFLAVAVLTMITTMTRLVNNQRTQIGILKAVGFCRRKIIFHYVSYGLWVSLSGSVLGAVLGPLTLPYLFYGPMMTTYTLPEWHSKLNSTVYLMVIAAVVVCTAASYLSCRIVLKDTPAQSLRPKSPKAINHSIWERTRLWNKLGFDTQWNLRDMIRCKGRSFMAIAGTLGCSALLICAFSLQDTMDYIIEWNYDDLNRYHTRIELKQDITPEQADVIQKSINGESIWEGGVELKSTSGKKSGELLIMDEVTLIKAVDVENHSLSLPVDEISISYKMAKNLDVKVGDNISWHLFGEEKWNTSRIGAIYRTPFAQGITMTMEYYESYGAPYHPSAIITSETDISDLVTKQTQGVSRIQTKEELIESYEIIKQAMDVMVYTLMLAAILLATVVIYNLSVLSLTERHREMSTLKVIGFQTRKLRLLLLSQNIWLTIAGMIPGIPVGILITNYIFLFIGDVFDFIVVIDVSSYLYCIAGTMIVSILMNLLFSKRVKEIDMVSSLKGVE